MLELQCQVPRKISAILIDSGLFDDFIRAGEERGRYCKSQGFCSLEVDDEMEFRRLLNRDVCGLGTFEDEVHNLRASPPLSNVVCAIGHKTARLDELPVTVNRGQVQLSGYDRDIVPLT